MLETTSITTGISITTEITIGSLETTTNDRLVFPINAKWKQNGVTIAGGHKNGNGLNQLYAPTGIYVDDDERVVYIADMMNNRVVQWKFHATSGEIIADENGIDELSLPTDVTVDKKNDSLIICENGGKRVVRWSRRKRRKQGIIMDDITCLSVVMDKNGDLYVSTYDSNNVKRWREGDTTWTTVAGGDVEGNDLNKLYVAGFLFIDQTYSIYVSDMVNNRVMKWSEGIEYGYVAAGISIHGTDLNQLHNPTGVLVDRFDSVYVADSENHRITRWISGGIEGEIILGGNGPGIQTNQLYEPYDISFDRQGNLYIVDRSNHRIQKLEPDSS
ncbi:unnamed protein product [Adineta steineri]|uniref:SMP-30/Gluconolactonase/LRE-like region domain-containing protein n=2 Tax=Adineta steineri TaxID=433720 RepID=A0A818TBK9_9BILA|nr:unnamed protein product [Adineta steineri]CAF3679556.1 unnamed protein product [Adineta steineri]